MSTTTAHRTEPGFEPGKALAGGHVVKSVEDYLAERLRSLIVARYYPTRKHTNYEKGNLDGEINAVADALSAVQAGGSYYGGDEPRRHISAVQQAVIADLGPLQV